MALAARPAGIPGPHLLLYDGVCGLCSGVVQRVVASDRAGIFHFAALQSEVAAEYLASAGAPQDMSTFVLIPDYQQGRRTVLTRSDAALFLFETLGWPWRIIGIGRLLPRSWRDRIYDSVARHRYSVFGQVDRCLLPSPDRMERFIDQPRTP
jgi:predicted DCC family thiol-disulfide oxidoreductase YuxK